MLNSHSMLLLRRAVRLMLVEHDCVMVYGVYACMGFVSFLSGCVMFPINYKRISFGNQSNRAMIY